MSGGHGHVDTANKKIALLVAVLAALLAVSEMSGKSAQTNGLSSHIDASNLWSFFQAKTIRQTTLRTAADGAARLTCALVHRGPVRLLALQQRRKLGDDLADLGAVLQGAIDQLGDRVVRRGAAPRPAKRKKQHDGQHALHGR